MNANADDATQHDPEATASAPSGDEGEAAPAKTVRRKRAVKAAESAPAETASDISAEASDEAPKPARKRRAAKAESEESAAPAEPVAAQPTEAEAPVKAPRKRAKKAAESAVEPSMPVQAELPMVAPDFVPAEQPARVQAQPAVAEAHTEAIAESAAQDGASSQDVAATPEGASPEGEDGAPGERSSRRRNRRDRRRGRDEAGAEQGGEAARPAIASANDGEDDEDAPTAEPTPNLPPADVGEVFQQVMSGEFDVDGETAEEPVPHKRVLLPEPDAPKLHKVLAQSGIGSRRDMEQAIIDGKVSVNGQTAHVGQRISFGDRVTIDGKPVKVRILPPPPRIIAYHKPVGEVVTNDDPQHRPTVFRRLPRLQQGKWQSVGRLDLNTEGLLLFTNSGELANQLMHPRFGVEREYAVRVLGKLDEDSKAELLEGVTVDGQTASFRSIEDGGGEGANHWYRVVITEGRNREVRKLFDEVGLTVSRLIRIRYGTVVLPRGLKRGVWVDLGQDDVRAIRQLAGGGQGQGQAREDRGGRNNRNKRNDRNDRNDRGGRSDRNDRGPRPNNGPQRGNNRPQDPVRVDQGRDRDDRDFDGDVDEEIDHSRIPNPLEQTFDKRFVQNPRSAVGGRGFRSGAGGFGSGGSGHNPAGGKKGGPKEPDPLQTSVGYIGADAFHRKGNRGGGRGGRGGGGGGGFGGGGGGGGGFGGNRRGR